MTSILTLAFKIATEEGMLLGKLGRLIQAKVDEGKKAYMLLQCIFCMPSLFGLFGFGFAYLTGMVQFTWNTLVFYIPTVCGSSVFCGGMWSVYQLISAKIDAEERYARNLDDAYYEYEPEYHEENITN
ncbi:MAG: hypothetical protein ABIN25_07190 [Ginsengibacter sp.]